jgi:hypothetical protein
MKKAGLSLAILLLMSVTTNAERDVKPQWKSGFLSVRSDRFSKFKRFKAPELSYEPIDERNHCAQIGMGLRICKYISDAKIVFAIEIDGKRLGEWPTTLYPVGASRFEVLKGDLDGDRKDELIVANLDFCCQSMGISRWTLSIFSNLEKGFQPPLEFSVEEYGAEGTFVKHSGDKRPHILVTEWQYLEHPKRGRGMYIVGRWFCYRAGRLVPVKNRPLVARRFLFGFAEKVDETRDNPRIPLMWFQNPQTEMISLDPARMGTQAKSLQGVIKDVFIPERGSGGIKLKIALRTGEEKNYKYVLNHNEDEETSFQYFGNDSLKMIYPINYCPGDWQRWLIGRRVRIATHRIDYLSMLVSTRQIMWLKEP